MKLKRYRIEALMSVCSILWVVGWLLFLDGEAQARGRRNSPRLSSSVSQPVNQVRPPQDSRPAKAGPEADALLTQPQEARQEDGNQVARQERRNQVARQEAGKQKAPEPEAGLRSPVFRFVDAAGVVYYTNDPCDSRYVQFGRCNGR